MIRLYESGLTYAEIGKRAGLARHMVSRRVRAAGRLSRSPSARRQGALNPAWRGGVSKDKRGYVRVWCPSSAVDRLAAIVSKSACRGRCKLEHRLVMEEHLGRALLPAEIVHHRNGDPQDNRLENLELTTRGAHVSHHARAIGWARDYDSCVQCGRTAFRHAGHGYCSACSRLRTEERTKERAPRPRIGRWAREWDCCRRCGTAARRHGGNGLCSSCKGKAWRADYDQR